MNEKNSTKRFSLRAEYYQKYRPDYPIEVIQEIKSFFPNKSRIIVADIGSGTGIFTKHLIDANFEVYAVEPNDEMRIIAEKSLCVNPNFHNIKGTAESTTLPDESIDLITAAQALHWFDPELTLTEFQRILQPEGIIAFIWNERDLTATPFMKEYDQFLIDLCPEYKNSPHLYIDKERIFNLIEEISLQEFHYSNTQEFDEKGFIGRVLSSSYTPLPGSAEYTPFIDALTQLFEKYQKEGKIQIHYNTHLYLGRVMRKWAF
ncbi:class I SAM-dependent methyltransferase [Candidatus Harpocratesius sp.]